MRLHVGAPRGHARAAVVLLHGRGSSAAAMRPLAEALAAPDVAVVVPGAPGGTWYPERFIAPLAANEPALSASLLLVSETLRLTGLPPARILLAGFSQGACLALEAFARGGQALGAVAGLSGGLIGTADTPGGRQFNYAGSLAPTPVLLSCSDADPHIPLPLVHRTVDVLAALGAVVDVRLRSGSSHDVTPDAIAWMRAHAERLAQEAA